MSDLSRWFAGRVDDPSTLLPLLCFPFAGGGAALYRDWPELLPGVVGVHPVVLPGRERRLREAPAPSFAAIVEELVPAFLAAGHSRYAVYGHSMGSVLAFEFARAMKLAGEPEPVLLAVSGYAGPPLAQRREPVHLLSDEELAGYLRSLGGTPSPVLDEPDLLRLFLPAVRADLRNLYEWSYREPPILNCPVLAWWADRDPVASADAVGAWAHITNGKFELRATRAGHFPEGAERVRMIRELGDALLDAADGFQ